MAMLDDPLAPDLEELAISYELARAGPGGCSYRDSETARELHRVQATRKIVESRGPWAATGVLWTREINETKERRRKEFEAARVRNSRIREEARTALAEMRATNTSAASKAAKAEVEAAKRQYLAHVHMLYPQWCRQVEKKTAEENQRLGNTLLDTQRRRLLAAEKFATQMAMKKEMAQKEQELLREQGLGHQEERQRAEQLRAASETTPGSQAGPGAGESPILHAGGDQGSPSFHHEVDRLGLLLKHSSPPPDPDMPPEMPPATREPPKAPSLGGKRWGYMGQDHPQPTSIGSGLQPGAAAVAMMVMSPEGQLQTVMVPVVAGAEGMQQLPMSQLNPMLAQHLQAPQGGAVTPVRNSSDISAPGNTNSPHVATVAADMLQQQLKLNRRLPMRYQNSSADVTPLSSIEMTASMEQQAKEAEAAEQREFELEVSQYDQEFTLADHSAKVAGSASTTDSERGEAKVGMGVGAAPANQPVLPSKQSAKGSQHVAASDSFLRRRPQDRGAPARDVPRQPAKHESSPDQSLDSLPDLSNQPRVRRRRSSDQELMEEVSAPSLALGMGGPGSHGSASPASSTEGGHLQLRSSVESRARSSHESKAPSSQSKSPLGITGGIHDSQDSAVSFDEEEVEQQRMAWNRELQHREEQVAEEKAEEEARRRADSTALQRVASDAAASSRVRNQRSERPLYRSRSSIPQKTQPGSRPNSAGPSTSPRPGPPLGVFGFGSMGGSGGLGSPVPKSGSLGALSNIVSRAMDDSLDNSDSDDSSVGSPGALPQVQPLYAGAGGRTASMNRSAASVADTSDEFDF